MGEELSLQQLLRPHSRLHLESPYAPEINPGKGVLAYCLIYAAINKCKLVQVHAGLNSAGGARVGWAKDVLNR